MFRRRLPIRRLAAACLALLTLTPLSAATWSIVMVNTKTGEIAIAGATCLENFNLLKTLPVVVVGVGGGVSQGQIDIGGNNRKYMFEQLMLGAKPSAILYELSQTPTAAEAKQWGLVNFQHAPATWSGNVLGEAYAGTTGSVGDIKFAIQGNVIAGPAVVYAATNAILTTPGDMSQKLMAGMEAARQLGGDGRCSCLTGGPASCGAPPPSFTKTAHCAFAVVARIGDVDGTCSATFGCATGDYYLTLANQGDWDDVDPVLTLQADYDLWRAGLAGKPDHLLSTVDPGPKLVADGVTTGAATVELFDVDGNAIQHGGISVTVSPAPGTTPTATAGTPTYLGGGAYSIPLTAGTTPGTDEFQVVVDDGSGPVTLYPYLEVKNVAVKPLHVGIDELSAAEGSDTKFVVNLGAGAGSHPFVLLGSASGTSPGIPLGGGATLPLNEDWFLSTMLNLAGSPVLPGSIGALDANGRAEAMLVLPGGALNPLVGLTLAFAAVDYAGPLVPTNAVEIDVAP